MKVLIDTNIILDLLCNREGFAENAAQLFRRREINQLEGYVSALSIPNIVYIMRKELDKERVSAIIQTLSSILDVTELKGSDMLKAAALPMNDFEDALQSVCASRIRASCIVTHSIKRFRKQQDHGD